MQRPTICIVAATLTVLLTGCGKVARPTLKPEPDVRGASLWVEPANIEMRDLFHGPWGAAKAPNPAAAYTLVERKHTGVNPGMTVVDPQGREWSVKQAPPGRLEDEGQVEVTVSRLLSAVGYHQPPIYYLPSFTLKDAWGDHHEIGGRFRLKEESLKDLGPWSLDENQFVGSNPFEGLLVMLMMFNSTDLKASNNTLYEHRRGNEVEHWYVVRDVGAALGDTNAIVPLKGNARAFARHPFILGVDNGYVRFAYKGLYKKLVSDRITPAHVRWASNLLGRLSERQWQDAFRAGGYSEQEASLFVSTLRTKIDHGRNLDRRSAN